ncbi:pre-RNA splicing factor [Niveomyces insectorum RCEF 264]|uniref:Pre-RNA splicing factor n=1 Tax=Niveomyces insectorum RCEF 264 TaxID=1081102 RepID=A0A167TEG1_9HYPO|nr:pre-RNA splicing factor [Niveomyces insectorum RCEF 264]
MPPQIKADLNRSGWEATDFPSVCENCLPENPYVRMLKEDYGAECKLCTRPFTIFSWPVSRAQGRKKRTNICLTCARLKNCCQSCTLDLSFGLPIAIRDAALKMVAPGPTSEINREYFAQNNHEAIEKGLIGEDYDNADDKARELLQRLAQSKPYFRKGRQVDEEGKPVFYGGPRGENGRVGGGGGGGGGGGATMGGSAVVGAGVGGPGPIRTRDSRAAHAAGAGANAGAGAGAGSGPGRPASGPRKGPAAALPPPGPKDWLPPADESIMSLFVTGVEDDLPEYKIRDFFKVHGKIRSLICSHMSHCAFINYDTRQAAEKAAAACQGRAVIAGCPLRVRWGQARPVGTMNREQRVEMIRDGRSAFPELRRRQARNEGGKAITAGRGEDDDDDDGRLHPSKLVAAAPPGAADVPYASLAGN